MHVCFACVDVCIPLASVVPAEEGIWTLRTGVKDGCESPCGFSELNPNPLQELPVCLTIVLVKDIMAAMKRRDQSNLGRTALLA